VHGVQHLYHDPVTITLMPLNIIDCIPFEKESENISAKKTLHSCLIYGAADDIRTRIALATKPFHYLPSKIKKNNILNDLKNN